MNPLLRDELVELFKEYANQMGTKAAALAPGPGTCRTAPRPRGVPPGGFEWFEANDTAIGPQLDTSARARDERTVLRVASYYPCLQLELRRLLDVEGVAAVYDLTTPGLKRVLKRITELEDAIQHGCGAPDAPPA